MPPKPSVARKQSVSSKDGPPKAQGSMPPPPDPPQPQGILVPEVMALSACLRNAVVKTGQIYGHYADTKKLTIHKYAPYPPRSLTASLGREVEKYNQLCDAIESHLLHSINVLQRDLSRAQDKLKAAAAVPMAVSPPQTQAPLPPSGSPTQPIAEDISLHPETKLLSGIRRASTISLSSLQRPPFPHKLDLSATALRINPDDPLSLQSGLASPVTLAPKSSISRHPPDLLGGQHVDIDLTLDDDDIAMSTSHLAGGSITGVGSSADKPIELDLDLEMDLFGDGGQQSAGASGVSAPHVSPVVVPKQEDTPMDLSMLAGVDSLAAAEMQQSNDAFMFNPGADLASNIPGHLKPPLPGHPSAPSPNSLLSGLQHTAGNGDHSFDFDLNFLEPSMDMRMEDIFSMAGQNGHNGGASGS